MPKKVKRKSTATKVASKAAPKSVAKKASVKIPAVTEAMSKNTLIKTLTEVSGVAKRDVTCVLETLTDIIQAHLKSRGPGVFVMPPSLFKVLVVTKPARPARDGINPFTGEKIRIKAKPASKAVKVKALKKLKGMIG